MPSENIFDPNAAIPSEPEESTLTPEQLDNMELSLLKERADQMKISYHPNIGVATLRAKIAAALNITAESTEVTEPAAEAPVESPQAYRMRMRAEAHKLIRVVVTCMNPNKNSLEGEVFTVSNSIVGTSKKYVPFNVDAGYHIPNIIYQHLVGRKCQIFYTTTDARTGVKSSASKLINEFNVVVLPPLTGDQLKDLATVQAASHSIDKD